MQSFPHLPAAKSILMQAGSGTLRSYYLTALTAMWLSVISVAVFDMWKWRKSQRPIRRRRQHVGILDIKQTNSDDLLRVLSCVRATISWKSCHWRQRTANHTTWALKLRLRGNTMITAAAKHSYSFTMLFAHSAAVNHVCLQRTDVQRRRLRVAVTCPSL